MKKTFIKVLPLSGRKPTSLSFSDNCSKEDVASITKLQGKSLKHYKVSGIKYMQAHENHSRQPEHFLFVKRHTLRLLVDSGVPKRRIVKMIDLHVWMTKTSSHKPRPWPTRRVFVSIY